MSEKDKKQNIQQDKDDSERGSQLQSNKLEEAQGNKEEEEDEDKDG